MLVLTRKPNQSIMIADNVEITVLSVTGDKVRLGIDAPREVPIFRKEVYLTIHEKQTARNGAAAEADAAAAAEVTKDVDAALGRLAEPR
ncbi:MAG: carbon storage regulator [Solirubrobacterales bacterium]|jgi:carbon storage regulator|nr:carbon storage regulator [Solirubrobacterales bacterium]